MSSLSFYSNSINRQFTSFPSSLHIYSDMVYRPNLYSSSHKYTTSSNINSIATYSPSSLPYIKTIEFSSTLEFNSPDNFFLQNPLLISAILETVANYMNISLDYVFVSGNTITSVEKPKSLTFNKNMRNLQNTYNLELLLNINLPLTGIYAYYFNNPTLLYNLLSTLLKTAIVNNNFISYLTNIQSFISTLLINNPSLLELTNVDISPMAITYIQAITDTPTSSPTYEPTCVPTYLPTDIPSIEPTLIPTHTPSYIPTSSPTSSPSYTPINIPTSSPTIESSIFPTNNPTIMPSSSPTLCPTFIIGIPSISPSWAPSAPAPSGKPTNIPSIMHIPSTYPTNSQSPTTFRPTNYIGCGYPCKKNISDTLLPNEESIKMDSSYSTEEVAIFSLGILVISIGIIFGIVYGSKILIKRNQILYPDNSLKKTKKFNSILPYSLPSVPE